MKRSLTVLMSLVMTVVILSSFGFRAFAVGSSIFAPDVTAKENRLFDVKVGVKSHKALSAGTFELKYDRNKYEFREFKTEASSCEAKSSDKDGVVRVVFLCENGLLLDNTPLLFTVKFKKLNAKPGSIKISASDFVDEKVRSFKLPSAAICKISSPGSAGSKYTASGQSKRKTFGSGYRYKSSGGSARRIKTSDKKSGGSGRQSSSPSDKDEQIETYYTPYNNSGRHLAPEYIYAIVALAAAVIIAVCVYNKKKKSTK